MTAPSNRGIQHSSVEEGTLFNRLPAIFDHLALKDPGGHFVLKNHTDDRFSQLFISPSFAKSCFENAKPVIGIDGAHTRNAIKQILLLATVEDGNNTIMEKLEVRQLGMLAKWAQSE
jgi:hypothetical protein